MLEEIFIEFLLIWEELEIELIFGDFKFVIFGLEFDDNFDIIFIIVVVSIILKFGNFIKLV